RAQLTSRHGDGPRADALEAEVELALERRVRAIIVDADFERTVGRDEVEVEALDAQVRAVFAEVALEVEREQVDADTLDVARLQRDARRLVAAERAFGAHGERLLLQRREPPTRICLRGPESDCAVGFDRRRQIAETRLEHLTDPQQR